MPEPIREPEPRQAYCALCGTFHQCLQAENTALRQRVETLQTELAAIHQAVEEDDAPLFTNFKRVIRALRAPREQP